MSSPLSSNIVPKSAALNLERLWAWSHHYRLQGMVLLSLLGFNLIFSLGFVTPVYRHVVSTEAGLKADRSKVARLLQYQKTQEAVKDLEETFFTQQELALLAGRLPAIAKRHQLLLPGLNYQNERQGEGETKKVVLKFKLSGRYDNIRRFIHEVEGLDTFLYIQNMNIGSSEKGSDRLDLQMQMVAVLHDGL